jgi:hypothetical protein
MPNHFRHVSKSSITKLRRTPDGVADVERRLKRTDITAIITLVAAFFALLLFAYEEMP